jgi:hypothetical protein
MARRIGPRRLTKLAALYDSPVDVGMATALSDGCRLHARRVGDFEGLEDMAEVVGI